MTASDREPLPQTWREVAAWARRAPSPVRTRLVVSAALLLIAVTVCIVTAVAAIWR